MTDLRPQAIEAMAKAAWEAADEAEPWGEPGRRTGYYQALQNEQREMSAAGLDALVGFLTEHADEWADYPEASDPIVVAHREIIARKLLAVLS